MIHPLMMTFGLIVGNIIAKLAGFGAFPDSWIATIGSGLLAGVLYTVAWLILGKQ